jgi:hypothetical protein
VSSCDHEALILRRPFPTRGCWAMGGRVGGNEGRSVWRSYVKICSMKMICFNITRSVETCGSHIDVV